VHVVVVRPVATKKQVGRSIVSTVAVDVVDNLTDLDGPTNHLLHDHHVL